jgi:hypothetical protein
LRWWLHFGNRRDSSPPAIANRNRSAWQAFGGIGDAQGSNRGSPVETITRDDPRNQHLSFHALRTPILARST